MVSIVRGDRWHVQRRLLAIVLACPISVGCSPGIRLAAVSGVVTKADKPQPAVVVQFNPVAGGRAAEAMTDGSGHYVLQFSFGRSGAPPGKHSVTVMTDSIVNEEGRELAGRKTIYTGQYEVKSGANTIDIAIP